MTGTGPQRQVAQKARFQRVRGAGRGGGEKTEQAAHLLLSSSLSATSVGDMNCGGGAAGPAGAGVVAATRSAPNVR